MRALSGGASLVVITTLCSSMLVASYNVQRKEELSVG
jgi:hypothetical protein